MRKKVIKFQAVVFGTFNFPADPGTTVKLMTIFAPHGYMPQVISGQDVMGGGGVSRLSLTKGEFLQIVFSPDRIDFSSVMPTISVADFVAEVSFCVSQLESGNLRFHRVALVIDNLLEEISSSESDQLRQRLLPNSKEGAIDWTARWVDVIDHADERYNFCFEVLNSAGMMMINNGRMHPLNGIKVMHDVSTTPSNTSHRFDSNNLAKSLSEISKLIEINDLMK